MCAVLVLICYSLVFGILLILIKPVVITMLYYIGFTWIEKIRSAWKLVSIETNVARRADVMPICNMAVNWNKPGFVRFLLMYSLYCDNICIPSQYIIIDAYISLCILLFDGIFSDALTWEKTLVWGRKGFQELGGFLLILLHAPWDSLCSS